MRDFDEGVVRERLKALRVERDMNYMQFGAAIGAASAHMIKHWEDGRNVPSAYYLFQVARAFGVTADWLLGLTEERGERNG